MLRDPIQAKAFQELECIVGSSRVPTYDDLANLPYINACLEVLTILIDEVFQSTWSKISLLADRQRSLPERFDIQASLTAYPGGAVA